MLASHATPLPTSTPKNAHTSVHDCHTESLHDNNTSSILSLDHSIAMTLSIPGFSAEQVNALTKLMKEMLDRAFEKHFDPLSPQPNQAQQTIAEDSLESTTKKRRRRKKKSTVSSSNPVNTSPLPTIPRLRTMSTCREFTSCLSTARVQYTSNLAPLFASQHTSLFALASPLSYIRHAKDMKATDQG